MTVLPTSEMRSGPAGTVTRAAGPTATILPSRTTIVELSIGGAGVPPTTRAPVNALTAGDCASTLKVRLKPEPTTVRTAAVTTRIARGETLRGCFMRNNIVQCALRLRAFDVAQGRPFDSGAFDVAQGRPFDSGAFDVAQGRRFDSGAFDVAQGRPFDSGAFDVAQGK